jgi:hypothetical protein
MIYGRDRDEIRGFFCTVWAKHCARLPLEPLEHLVADVILAHPEYHELLRDPEAAARHDALPEKGQTNPFLHMGMHIGLREQLATDRPAGVAHIYQTLLRSMGDKHSVEHRMMECLGLVLWEAQRAARVPDEERFLDCLRGLAKGSKR